MLKTINQLIQKTMKHFDIRRMPRGTFFKTMVAVVSATFLLPTLVALAAWSDPSAPPTGGNPDAPLNVGSSPQTKIGNLTLKGLASIEGDAFLDGHATAGDSNIAFWMTEAGSTGNEYSWKLWTSNTTGSGGLLPNAFEVWEYPDSVTAPATCCKPRLRIEKSPVNAQPFTVDIDPNGHVNMQGGAIRFYEDRAGGGEYGRVWFTPNGNFHIDSDGSKATYINHFRGTGGVIIGNGLATGRGDLQVRNVLYNGTLTNDSSRRFKKDITDTAIGLNEILNLRPVTYQYIDQNIRGTQIGLIAEEVAPILNTVVAYDKEGQPSGIDYTKLTIPLINAVQTLNDKIEALEEKTILKSPNGTCFEVTVDDDGALSTRKTECRAE